MAVTDDRTMLRDFWYLVVAATAVAKGKTIPATLLGEPLIIGRSSDNTLFAYGDACPHRGMPLRHGSFDGRHLRCCYHGWAFDAADGNCVEIPALPLDDVTDPGRIRLRAYPIREVQGNIWVFMPADRLPPDPLPAVPTVPGFDGKPPQVTTTMRFPSNADVAAMGFCDPAHPAFVHTSRWWKSKSALALRPKAKAFEPVEHGFRMKQHQLKGGANPYRLLGSDVRVDVAITLPGLRIEHIRGTRHSACVLAAVTPISENETDVHYCVYWTIPWLAPLRPLATWMARDFLRQDMDVAAKLAGGPATPPMLFVGDADKQVAWLLRLKREYLSSRAEDRAFVNPVRDQILHWRS